MPMPASVGPGLYKPSLGLLGSLRARKDGRKVGGDVACLPSMHKILGFITGTQYTHPVVAHTYNLSTWEVGTGRSGVQGQDKLKTTQEEIWKE